MGELPLPLAGAHPRESSWTTVEIVAAKIVTGIDTTTGEWWQRHRANSDQRVIHVDRIRQVNRTIVIDVRCIVAIESQIEKDVEQYPVGIRDVDVAVVVGISPDKLDFALIGDAIAVVIETGGCSDVTLIRDPVAVAVLGGSIRNVAPIRLVVTIAIDGRIHGYKLSLATSVAVDIDRNPDDGSSPVGEITRSIGRAIEIISHTIDVAII